MRTILVALRLPAMGQKVTCHMLDKGTYLEAIRGSVPLMAAAARSHLSVPVPTCPGWYMATLVAHIAEVERFWAFQVQQRASHAIEVPEHEMDAPPGVLEWFGAAEDGDVDTEHVPPGLIDWFERSAAKLIDTFEDVDPEEAIWHWSGDNRAITHMRNGAMEHTVHRWDAQNAVGRTTPIDAAIARDGIEQHLEVQITEGRKWKTPVPGHGETFHLHRTDGDGEWLVRFQDATHTVTREHAKADVAVRGTAQELFLWLWGRTSGETLEVFGDRSLFERYRELAPTG